MDDELIDRLDVIGRDLNRRAQKLGQSSAEEDTALLMQGLAAALEAIRSLGKTTRRMDGPEGLGESGE